MNSIEQINQQQIKDQRWSTIPFISGSLRYHFKIMNPKVNNLISDIWNQFCVSKKSSINRWVEMGLKHWKKLSTIQNLKKKEKKVIFGLKLGWNKWKMKQVCILHWYCNIVTYSSFLQNLFNELGINFDWNDWIWVFEGYKNLPIDFWTFDQNK